MGDLSRRAMIRASLGTIAGTPLARPFIANAAATTATVWLAQGFVQNEDIALRNVVAAYEKASGNTIDLSIIPFAPERQKIVSALTSGVVPDLVDSNPGDIISQYAWQDKWVDVSDVVATQKDNYSQTALRHSHVYNNVEKRRSHYGVPYRSAVPPCHMWKSLIEKAGFTMSDVPKTWDAYFDFFRQVQDRLRKQGMRKVYGLGFQLTANGNDPNTLFQTFLIANGGKDWVTPDGKLHLDDPTVRQAVIRSMTYLAAAYKDGYVPPSAINWNDADDNNAFHAQQIVMDVDGTLSTEVAVKDKNPDWYFNDIRSQGIPLDNAGKPVPSLVGFTCGLIPKGAKNVAVAKEFLTYFIRPEVTGKYIETGLGRFLPVMPELAKSEFWQDPKDPHLGPYIQQGLLGPSVPPYYVYNPAVSEVDAHHIWSVAIIEIMTGGAKPEEAAAKAFQQIEAIFAKYVIEQS